MIFIWFFKGRESGEFCMFAPIFLDEKNTKNILKELSISNKVVNSLIRR